MAASVSDIASLTAAKTVAYGTTALYWAGVPLVLYVAATRRGLDWSEVAKAALRLPFAWT